jgi:ketosteroid isomerase-like protein
MSLDVQQVSDRMEINDLLHRYTYAVDGRDWDLLATCFTPDATIDFSAAAGPAGALPDLVAWLTQTLAMFAVTQHHVTNSVVSVDGDVATGQAYFFNPMTITNEAGGTELLVSGGYYDDRFHRTADGWRIVERRARLAMLVGPLRPG